jgi:hypothetical protein
MKMQAFVNAFNENRFVFTFGSVMLAMGALYFAYKIADGAFLSETKAVGKVIGKEHVPASEQYRLEKVGNISQTVKIMVPDAWLLDVDLGGPHAKASVDFIEFQRIFPGTEVQVQYRKHRLSGNLEVTNYFGKTGG